MRDAVNLCQQTTKSHAYWVIRWRGTDGRHYGKTVGRTDQLSKRQAEKRRREKEFELAKQPGRRNVSRSPLLGDYLASYFESRKSELAQGTMDLHRQTGRYLEAFFGKARRLDSIQRADARAFKAALAGGKLAYINQYKRKKKSNLESSTVNLNVRNARTIFSKALDDDLILFNPFDRLAETCAVIKDWHYVSLEEFHQRIDGVPQAWRLLFALTRLAALRRGEALNLRWSNIDWDQARLVVIASDEWKPKDRDHRTVPIVPALYALLLEAFEAAKPGSERVIAPGTIKVKNITRDFAVLCRKAKLPKYAKPTHTLRKSCLTDWAKQFPAHVVKEWAGHSSIETTDEFYLKVSDADYNAASGRFSEKGTQLGTQPAKNEEKPAETEKEEVSEADDNSGVTVKAGERIRTVDVQLGKLAFYH